jgi:uncharacterized protein YkwD
MSGKPATRRRASGPPRGPAKVIHIPTPKVVKRRRAIKAGFGLLILSLIGAILARLYWTRTAPPTPEKVSGLSEQESEVLGLVNQERARAGQQPLKFSPRLAVIARGHSYDMAMRHYLARESPEGVAPADRITGVGIGYHAVGENIYMDDYGDPRALATHALRRWLDSPTHQANLLSGTFTETGVGIAHASDGSTYVTQDFVR